MKAFKEFLWYDNRPLLFGVAVNVSLLMWQLLEPAPDRWAHVGLATLQMATIMMLMYRIGWQVGYDRERRLRVLFDKYSGLKP
jgi:hypothetical protein